MNDRMARSAARSMLCATAAMTRFALTTLALGAFVVSGALAQTLTDPNPPAKWSPPRTIAKSRPTAPQKSCSGYGAGFVKVPGTDTCVKIGGWVTVEGSAGR